MTFRSSSRRAIVLRVGLIIDDGQGSLLDDDAGKSCRVDQGHGLSFLVTLLSSPAATVVHDREDALVAARDSRARVRPIVSTGSSRGRESDDAIARSVDTRGVRQSRSAPGSWQRLIG